jgi:hypothetical protein
MEHPARHCFLPKQEEEIIGVSPMHPNLMRRYLVEVTEVSQDLADWDQWMGVSHHCDQGWAQLGLHHINISGAWQDSGLEPWPPSRSTQRGFALAAHHINEGDIQGNAWRMMAWGRGLSFLVRLDIAFL